MFGDHRSRPDQGFGPVQAPPLYICASLSRGRLASAGPSLSRYLTLETANVQIRLRSSAIAAADNCRRLLQYQYLLKVEPVAVAANLAFGRCIDISLREYLRALTLGQSLPDPVARFQALWGEQQTQPLVYSKTQSHPTFARMGVSLMRAFPACWEASGFVVAVNSRGDTLLDVSLSQSIGRIGRLEVVLDGTLDMLAYTPEAELAIVDVKTAASAHTALYTHRSDQLTVYQILVEAHRGRLGLPPLRHLGFLDLLKRRATARIDKPCLVPVRSRAELDEFKQKCFWLAEDIARGRFPRSSRMQFNSPCELCAYSRHCVHGDAAGLRFPAEPVKRLA